MRGAALACVIATALACSSKKTDPAPAAKTLADGLSAALEVVLADARPPLCAVWPKSAAPAAEVSMTLGGGSRVERRNQRLSFLTGNKIAVVADARGPSSQLAATFAALREQWKADGVVLVIALGGMGQTADDLRPTLNALASPSWILLVNPGDRESVAALESVVKQMSKDLPVFSTTAIREVDISGARLALLPGVASESGLVAGADGCLHREEDASAMAAALASNEGPRIWMSYAAPRQRERGESATDLSEGVHSGEPELTSAITASGAQLVIHAQIDPPPATAPTGHVGARATTWVPLAVGPLEDLPLALGNAAASLKGKSEYGGVVVTVSERNLEWQRTRRVAPLRR